MNNKYFWAVIILLVLSLSLFSCVEEEPCQHIDANDDFLCDNCSEDFDDGLATTPVTIYIKLDNGTALAGVKLTLSRGGNTYSYTSGSDGSVKVDLIAGLYSVDYDYDTLPEYCTPDAFGVKIEQGKDSITLTVTDNTPDGSAEKPYFVSETETEITLKAGEEIHYVIRVSGERHVKVHNSQAVIGYNGEIYEAVDGVASLVIMPEQTDVVSAVFSVKNSSSESITTILEVNAPLGAYENPIKLSENGTAVTVNCDSIVYYSWVATADGILTLTANSDRNNIYVRRVLEGDVPVDKYSGGELTVSMDVLAGDVITIGVSALEAQQGHENQEYDVEISFALTIE